MTREREQGGICLYRSLYCAFQGWLGTPLAEHQIFFLADGFQLRYQTMIKDGPLTQSVRFEDNVKVFALLAERLGITYYYHQGPIDTPQDISAALSRRCPVLLFTHVDALPYDQSGKLRSEAYHCIRILQPITTDLTYADDFVPDLRGGYSTRIHHMKFEKNQRHFIGYGYFDGGNSRQSVEYGVIFRENMKRFLAGGQMGEISLGATGLTRFLEDCQILREIEFSQKRYVDLMMILKYQLYAAYVYWIESAEELGLITEHIRDQIHAVNALWRVCFSTLQISLTSGNILYFHRLLSFLPRLAQQLISLFASLLT